MPHTPNWSNIPGVFIKVNPLLSRGVIPSSPHPTPRPLGDQDPWWDHPHFRSKIFCGGILVFQGSMCVFWEKTKNKTPNTSILWYTFIFGKLNKNAYFEIANHLLLLWLSKEAQILKHWDAVQTFSSFLLLVRICLIFMPEPRSVLRVDVNKTTSFPGCKREKSRLHRLLYPRAQMPHVCPTFLFLGPL